MADVVDDILKSVAEGSTATAEPKVEEPAEPKVEKPEEPKVEAPKAAEPKEPTEPQVVKIGKKKEPKEPAKPEPPAPKKEFEPITDDKGLAIYQALKEGKYGDVAKVAAKLSKNYTDMDDASIVKEYLREANPTWSEKDVNDEFEFQYHLDADEYDEQEVLAAQRRIRSEAAKLRQDLIKQQAEIKLPDIPQTDNSRAIEEARQQWTSAVKETDTRKMSFGLGEDEQFHFEADEDAYSELDDYIANMKPETFLGERYVREGKDDVAALKKDIFFLDHKDDILKAIFEYGKTKGREDVLKNRAGTPQFGSGKTPTSGEATPKEKVLENFISDIMPKR